MTKEETLKMLCEYYRFFYKDPARNWGLLEMTETFLKTYTSQLKPQEGEGEGKVLISIRRDDLTEDKFNEYEIYYRLSENYIWCICWEEYLDKKETYMNWHIEMPISEIQALFQYPKRDNQ